MGKIVKAVKPFVYKNNSNFKLAVYHAWCEAGMPVVGGRPYEYLYESLSYHLPLPTFFQSKKEARLRFVEAANMPFDTFPDYLCYEIIPVFWDCWPRYYGKVAEWLREHRVNVAFFTSSQTAEKMRKLCPNINIYHLPEAIDTQLYKSGPDLKDRNYDYLEFGRCCNYVDSSSLTGKIKVLSSRNEKGALATRAMLIDALADSKITICLPRSVNQPEVAEGVETLTQRYWECMLSRTIIVGKAPKELIEIIGYNPVVELDTLRFEEQVICILNRLGEYQGIVDRNRKAALKYGDWSGRVQQIIDILEGHNYNCKIKEQLDYEKTAQLY